MHKYVCRIVMVGIFTLVSVGCACANIAVASKAYVDQIVASLTHPQSDWAQTDETANDFIKNKPDIDAIISALESKADSTDPRFDTIPTTAPTDTPPEGRVYIWFN
ncbi:MAG: hypothetical protein IJX89_05140 [Alphaproteobacteria bacterium]|nr:hypothetical protein [Alphaproteobacteria bacterium]